MNPARRAARATAFWTTDYTGPTKGYRIDTSGTTIKTINLPLASGFMDGMEYFNGKLIVNPGAKDASLVALEPATGKVVWKCPGKPASYGKARHHQEGRQVHAAAVEGR